MYYDEEEFNYEDFREDEDWEEENEFWDEEEE